MWVANPAKKLRLACGQGKLGVTDAVGFCYAVLEPSRDVRPVSTSDTHTFAAFGIRSLVKIHESCTYTLLARWDARR
jgi:hypothetical protein